jgi:hypothetical protein
VSCSVPPSFEDTVARQRALELRGDRSMPMRVTNWILPIALIVGGFKFTDWYPRVVERARAQAGPSQGDVRGPGTPAGAR